MKTAAWLLLLSLLLIASYQSVDGQRRAINQLKIIVRGLQNDVQKILSRMGEIYPNVTRLRPYSLFESTSVIGIYARFHWGTAQWKTVLAKKISLV